MRKRSGRGDGAIARQPRLFTDTLSHSIAEFSVKRTVHTKMNLTVTGQDNVRLVKKAFWSDFLLAPSLACLPLIHQPFFQNILQNTTMQYVAPATKII